MSNTRRALTKQQRNLRAKLAREETKDSGTLLGSRCNYNLSTKLHEDIAELIEQIDTLTRLVLPKLSPVDANPKNLCITCWLRLFGNDK